MEELARDVRRGMRSLEVFQGPDERGVGRLAHRRQPRQFLGRDTGQGGGDHGAVHGAAKGCVQAPT